MNKIPTILVSLFLLIGSFTASADYLLELEDPERPGKYFGTERFISLLDCHRRGGKQMLAFSYFEHPIRYYCSRIEGTPQ